MMPTNEVVVEIIHNTLCSITIHFPDKAPIKKLRNIRENKIKTTLSKPLPFGKDASGSITYIRRLY